LSDPHSRATTGEQTVLIEGAQSGAPLTLCYELEGDPKQPCIVLIMGLGMQLISWPDAMRHALVDAGYCVLRFDNRDIGRSTHLQVRTPGLLWAVVRYRLGIPVQAPYTLRDMASDTAALLDALSIEHAHVLGVSMGGMVAQSLAAHYPHKVRTLVSIMSTSGARGLPQAQPHVRRSLLSRPLGKGKKPLIDHDVTLFKLIGSPAFPIGEADLRARVTRAVERSIHPEGFVRQLLAVAASGDRRHELRRIVAPSLVIHGVHDLLVPLPCGEDTARHIPDAKFVPVAGMGHDLAPGVVDVLLREVLPFLKEQHAAR
jgi:pimeloyl-ACP methyl ester carboxylesterase